MISSELMEKLAPVTQEEKKILAGANEVDRSLYTEGENHRIRAKKLLQDGKLITLRTHTRFVHFPAHTHDYVELVYMCRGKTEHIVNGKKILLEEGELLFLGQNATQEILPAREEDVAVNFIILPAFFHRTLEMLGEEDSPMRRFLVESLFKRESAGYLHFRVSGILPVQNLVENLIWNLLKNEQNKRNLTQITMALLVMQLTGHMDKLAHQSKEEDILVQVYRYIETNYRSGSLKEAAGQIHCDFYWLSHFLPRQTGKTYTALVQDKRLSQAAYLLKHTGLGVDDISLAVGYENKSYFHRLFFSRFGVTPKQYRDGV